MNFYANNCAFNKTLLTQKLMLFDLGVGGHHPSYISYLVKYWCEEKMEGQLFIVTSPEFLERHEDVVDLANSSTEFVTISPEESSRLSLKKGIIQRAFFEWQLHCKYAAQLQVSHSLLMYFDHLQLPIIFGQKSPCPVLGIYFRPSFHYKDFDNYVPTLEDAWRGWRQKVLLSLVLKNRQLSGLLCLDKYSVPYIRALSSKNKRIEYLPDPVTIVSVDPFQVNAFKKNLDIETGRKIFLLFGHLDYRKGIYTVLEAAKMLEEDIARQCCFLLVGEIPISIKPRILNNIADLRRESSIQIIMKNNYQPEEMTPLYISMADVILTPYQRHIGMSGVWALGFSYKKPILSSSYGLIGRLTQEYELGISVETSNPKLLSESISSFLNQRTCQTLKSIKTIHPLDEYNCHNFSHDIFCWLTDKT